MTLALEPMAVALVIPAAPFEEVPMKVLLFSPMFDNPLCQPKNELNAPLVLFAPESLPKKELKFPLVFDIPELRPK